MKLFEIAHSRTGDKGNISNISVIAYDLKDYDRIAEVLTIANVQAHFKDIVIGPIERYELPQLGALNFVMHNALAGGVTNAITLDKHGKTLSSYLLQIEV